MPHKNILKCLECKIVHNGYILEEGVIKDNVQVVAEICAAVMGISALEQEITGFKQLAKLLIEAVIESKVVDLIIGLLVKICANREVKSAIHMCCVRACSISHRTPNKRKCK